MSALEENTQLLEAYQAWLQQPAVQSRFLLLRDTPIYTEKYYKPLLTRKYLLTTAAKQGLAQEIADDFFLLRSVVSLHSIEAALAQLKACPGKPLVHCMQDVRDDEVHSDAVWAVVKMGTIQKFMDKIADKRLRQYAEESRDYHIMKSRTSPPIPLGLMKPSYFTSVAKAKHDWTDDDTDVKQPYSDHFLAEQEQEQEDAIEM